MGLYLISSAPLTAASSVVARVGNDLIPQLVLDCSTGAFYLGTTPIPSSTFKTVSVTAQSSDLLTLLATPLQVVAAPGTGYILQPLFCSFQYVHKTTDYTLGDVSQLFIGPSVGPTSNNILSPIPATILDGSIGAGNIVGSAAGLNSVQVTQSVLENSPLVLTHNGTGEITAGDGTLSISLVYATSTVS